MTFLLEPGLKKNKTPINNMVGITGDNWHRLHCITAQTSGTHPGLFLLPHVQHPAKSASPLAAVACDTIFQPQAYHAVGLAQTHSPITQAEWHCRFHTCKLHHNWPWPTTSLVLVHWLWFRGPSLVLQIPSCLVFWLAMWHYLWPLCSK